VHVESAVDHVLDVGVGRVEGRVCRGGW
jgi:hypothetical protein